DRLRKPGVTGWPLLLAASREARERGIDLSNNELAQAVFGRATINQWGSEDVGAHAARVAAAAPCLTPEEARALKDAGQLLDGLVKQGRYILMALEQRPQRAEALGRVLLSVLRPQIRERVREVLAEQQGGKP